MHDDTNLDFRIMNADLRARLIECVTDEDFTDLIPIINRVTDGTPVTDYDADADENDLPDDQRVALMIDYYWGNFA